MKLLKYFIIILLGYNSYNLYQNTFLIFNSNSNYKSKSVSKKFINYNIDTKKNNNLITRFSQTIISPPSNNIKSKDKEKDPKYIECIIEYYSKFGKISIESWMFNINAIIENAYMNTPSFLRFLFLNSYILGKTKSITCTGWDEIIYQDCIECVKLLAGGIYDSGIIIPIYNENNESISIYNCLNNYTNPFYQVNDININNFCKTSIISFQDE